MASDALLGVGGGFEARMQRRHQLAPVERPDMHVMDVRHALGMRSEIGGDGIPVDMRRRRLEQDQPGFAHQPPGADDKQSRDQDREQRIGRQPAGREDDERRDDRRDRAEQIAEHMQDRAAEIERLAVAAGRAR